MKQPIDRVEVSRVISDTITKKINEAAKNGNIHIALAELVGRLECNLALLLVNNDEMTVKDMLDRWKKV